MEEKTWCVYKHENPYNGKKYIGITKNEPETRWNSGFGYFNNKYFFHDICSYGWINFNHFILIENLSENEAKAIESLLIHELDTTNPLLGYNINKGEYSDWYEYQIEYNKNDKDSCTIRRGRAGTPCVYNNKYYTTIKCLADELNMNQMDLAQMLNPNCSRKMTTKLKDGGLRYATEQEKELEYVITTPIVSTSI